MGGPDAGYPGGMSEQPDQREPDDSPARRLLEDLQAYEVDPPAPARPVGEPAAE